jgi:hypothetical protein
VGSAGRGIHGAKLLGFRPNARFDDVGNLALLITMSDGVPVLVTGARHSLRDHEPHFPPANR